MKNRKTIILYFFLLSLFGVYSCVFKYYDESYSAENPPAFIEYHRYEQTFLYGSSPLQYPGELKENEEKARNHKKSYEGSTYDLYIDARTEEGYSTWSQPKHTFTMDRDAADASFTVNKNRYHNHTYKGKIILSSPPAHLHLCLRSWDDRGYGFGLMSKIWGVESITNESGQSLVDDPDWSNYTDNRMNFQKANKFVYTPGPKRSATEIDLFEAYPKNLSLTGTYSVKEDESKKVTLTVNFPKFSETFEVVASSWTSLLLKGSVKGKTGYMQLKPVGY